MAVTTMVRMWTAPCPPHRPWVTKRRLCIGGAGLTCSALAAVYRASPRKIESVFKLSRKRRRALHPLLVEAVSGALGEIVQVAVLYPLDTIKVKCQANGLGSRAVVDVLCSQRLGLLGTVRSLYAGCGPATSCAAVIGAVYLVSFLASQRLVGRAMVGARQWSAGRRAGRDPRSFAAGASGQAAEAEAADSPVATLAAGVVSSIATSVLEAPAELFRHRQQAGLMSGGMLGNMAAALRSGGGVRSLYGGYTAFMLKGIPYDVAELFTYTQLAALQARLPASARPLHCWSSLAIGAAAGAAAVLASMPADCIKLRMALAPPAGGAGPTRGLVQFAAMGRAMVAHGGPSVLFLGCLPRLAEKVPSTTLYWLTVDMCRRALRSEELPWGAGEELGGAPSAK